MRFDFLTKKAVKRALTYLLISISLAGCDGNEAWCLTTAPSAYTTDSIETKINTIITVNANGKDSNSVGLSGVP